MKASLKTLKDMATRLGATTNILRERLTYPKTNQKSKLNDDKKDEKRVAEVLIRKLRKDDREEERVIDLRLAVMGGQDAGKSTLLGN
jgi:GTPase